MDFAPMNMSEACGDYYTMEYCKKHADRALPWIGYLAFIMFFGFLGNFFIIIHFSVKRDVTVSGYFVTVLAAINGLCCVTFVPYEIELHQEFFLFNEGRCRFITFFEYSCEMAMMVIYLSLSVNRYRNLQHPLRFIRSVRKEFKYIIFPLIYGVLINIPVLVLYGKETITVIEDSDGYNCTVSLTRCTIDDEYKDTTASVIFGVFTWVNHSIIWILTVCFYVAIARKKRKQKAKLLKLNEGIKKEASNENMADGKGDPGLPHAGDEHSSVAHRALEPGSNVRRYKNSFKISTGSRAEYARRGSPSSHAFSVNSMTSRNLMNSRNNMNFDKTKLDLGKNAGVGDSAGKVIVIVNTLYYILWTPLGLLLLLKIFKTIDMENPNYYSSNVFLIPQLMGFSNFILLPIVMYGAVKEHRRELWDILFRQQDFDHDAIMYAYHASHNS